LVLVLLVQNIPAEDMVWMPKRIMGHVSKSKHHHPHLTQLVDDSSLEASFPSGEINETEVGVMLEKLLDSYDVRETHAELERLEALEDIIKSDHSFDTAWAMETTGMVSVFSSAKSAALEGYNAMLTDHTGNTTNLAAARAAASESVMEVLGGTWSASQLMMAAALAAKAAAEATKDAKGTKGDQLYAACEAAAELMVRRDQGWAMAAETAAKAAVKAGGTPHDARRFAADIAARYARVDKGTSADIDIGRLGAVGTVPLDKAKAVAAAFDLSLAAGEEKRDALDLAAHAAGLASRSEAKKLLLLERKVSGSN
jgi:hypothetical protein